MKYFLFLPSYVGTVDDIPEAYVLKAFSFWNETTSEDLSLFIYSPFFFQVIIHLLDDLEHFMIEIFKK